MSPGAIVAIIVAVAVVVAAAGVLTVSRRRAMRRRFGPEYDRLVAELGSHRKAQAELAERERRVQSLGIQPLPEAARAAYTAEWAGIQERFVDHPPEAVTQAGMLIMAVMKERGYPADDHDQVLADLSVAHPNTLGHYRAARQISMDAEAGHASTEDLRLGMLHYRALFTELLGGPAEQEPGPGDAPRAEPAAHEPAPDEPAADEPAAAEPDPAHMTSGPAPQEPAADEPAAAEPDPARMTSGPAPREPAADEPATAEPDPAHMTWGPAPQESAADEPATAEPVPARMPSVPAPREPAVWRMPED